MNIGNYNNTWAQTVANLKIEYPELTDDDFKFFAGYEDQMLSKLQNKLNLSPSQMEELRMQIQLKDSGNHPPRRTSRPGWQNPDVE